jgi:hypothetical protein
MENTMGMDKQNQPKDVDSQIVTMIDKKFALMEQLLKVKGDIRQLDREMVKLGAGRADVQAVLLCW